jgi:hypothetical protein
MTEAEWLACADPNPMLQHLEGIDLLGERKLRLFACACVRSIWHLLTHEADRNAVETAERYADGLAGRAELRAAVAAAALAAATTCRDHAGKAACEAVRWTAAALAGHDGKDADAFAHAQQQAQADLLRDLYGNPFRVPVVEPAWLAWHDGTVGCLARAVYDGHRFIELPVLADALEEAGCGDLAILGHCRRSGVHARGCWVLDLLLQRT